MTKIRSFLISIFIILVTIEIFAFIVVKFFNYTNIWYKYPTYMYWRSTIKEVYDPLGPHYIDTDSVSWGTWHMKNSEIRHKGDCYDVNMKFNSIGARGSLPSKADTTTTIFLGDSFIEGFALAENETIPAQYSNFKKVAALNLGGGGSFGSTQMAMVYDSLGSQFKHKSVIVCLYLENDFVDDDINQYYPSRYRPYLLKVVDNQHFKVVYKDSLKNSLAKFGTYSKGQIIETIRKYSISDYFHLKDKSYPIKLLSLTYSSRLFMEIFYRAQNKNQLPMELRYSQINIDILKYNLSKIATSASKSGAEMYVLNIPSKYLMYSLEKNTEYKTKIDSVINNSISGKNVHYLDFTQHLITKKTKIEDIYFDCDSHFNQRGAYLLAEYLIYHTNY